VDQNKILSVGVGLTDNLGDVAISDMLHKLFSDSGYQVEKMDFNFRAVVFNAFLPLAHMLSTIGAGIKWHKIPRLKNRYLRIVLNILKLSIYLPIVFIEFIRKSKGCSKVFIGGGNLLMGIEHGFPLQALIYVLFSRLFGKSVSFICVGAGPFTALGVKPILRMALRLSDRVICRDTKSKELIETVLGSSLVDIEVLPDPVLVWPKVEERTEIKYEILFTFLPLFSSTIFPDGDEAKADGFKLCMVDLIVDLIHLGRKVGVFVTDSSVDLAFSEEIVEEIFTKTGVRLEIKLPTSPDDMAALVSSAGVVFSTRMHGAIMALSQSVPALCVSWQSKVRGVYADLQINNLLVELDELGRFSIQDVLGVISEIRDNPKRYSEDIDQKLEKLRAQYMRRWASL
jgi:polysaccharide pyruvyl transferase WcaK-like protein